MGDLHWLSRTKQLLGEKRLNVLQHSNVLVAGLGGVGSYAAEAICRAGVPKMTIVDSDVVTPSNRNRQLLALQKTEGLNKVAVMEERLKEINPEINLSVKKIYLKDEKIPAILEERFDYVVDAIDTLSPKIFFIKFVLGKGYPLVSSMGSGGRLDPSFVKVDDLSRSYGCNFARIVRKKLHGLGIRDGFKVVFSDEMVPEHAVMLTDNEANKKSIVGTISYMPAIFGLTAASVVIRDLISHET
jgi:tRNA A37 threonylcarbamoyladenosine dehydratase